jgi:membrane protease YdiL (CAAX protease family)
MSEDAIPSPRPRIWTVFAAFVVALLGAIVLQILAGILFMAWHVWQGNDASLGQICVALAAIVPAWLSPEPAVSRLGIVRPRVPLWSLPLFAVGALVPLAIGVALAVGLTHYLKPDPTAARLYEQMTWPWTAPFVLFIALVPGLFEEVLFRGYMQRRLLQRWPAWVAILVASSLFGIMHIMPHAVVFAFAIGLWLGVLAWRTDSVWPSVVCHAFINGSWNIWHIGRKLADWPAVPPMPLTIALAVAVVGCFVASVWILWFSQGELKGSVAM